MVNIRSQHYSQNTGIMSPFTFDLIINNKSEPVWENLGSFICHRKTVQQLLNNIVRLLNRPS